MLALDPEHAAAARARFLFEAGAGAPGTLRASRRTRSSVWRGSRAWPVGRVRRPGERAKVTRWRAPAGPARSSVGTSAPVRAKWPRWPGRLETRKPSSTTRRR